MYTFAWRTAASNSCIAARPMTAISLAAFLVTFSKARRALEKVTRKAASDIAVIGRAAIQELDAAVRQAKVYMKGKRFASWHRNNRDAARQIVKLLHYPKFDFSRNEWVRFYDIESMGSLVHIYKYRVFTRE